VAKLANVNVETVRFYQRRGLLKEPPKPRDGYRRYGDEMVDQIRFIKRAQLLGFTLEEVAGLLKLEDARACAETRSLAAHKLELITRKLEDLSAMQQALADLVVQCDQGGRAAGCPIIQALSKEESEPR